MCLIIAYKSYTQKKRIAISHERKKKCQNPRLNQGPPDLQSDALPTELFEIFGRQYYAASDSHDSTWECMCPYANRRSVTVSGRWHTGDVVHPPGQPA